MVEVWHIHIYGAILKQQLPLQVKFLIEGQEENGSDVLESKLAEIGDQIACDLIVISDSSQYAKGQPAITYGLRGIAYYELRVHGPKADLHSGSFGGAIYTADGDLTVSNSTLFGNSSIVGGGAIASGGGQGLISVSQSTLSGNLTTGDLGGGSPEGGKGKSKSESESDEDKKKKKK